MADNEVSVRVPELTSVCTPCSRKGNRVKAENYCLKCEMFYCQQCLDKHSELMDFHPITNTETTGEVYNVMNGNLITDVCEKHFKLLDMYCQDEDVLACATCIALGHRSCDRVLYIPGSTEDLLLPNNIEELNNKLSATIDSLKSINITKQSSQTDLDDGKKQCLEEVDTHHKQLQSLLDNIIKASKDDIENRYRSLSTELTTQRQTVERCIKDLTSAKACLSSCHDNKAQKFVELKKCQKLIKETDEITTPDEQNFWIKISFDVRLENLLTELRILVTLVDQLTIKKKYEAEVEVEEDTEVVLIEGMCLLNDGSLLMADRYNNRLKRFDPETLTITDTYKMNDRPSAVCCVSDNEACVAQEKQLVFVSLEPRLAVIRTVTLDHRCWSVAYKDRKLYVTDQSKTMYVYTIEGTLLRSVTPGEDLFEQNNHLALSDDGKKVYVTDWFKGLVTFDQDDRIIGNLDSSEITDTTGVCLDGSGGLFICGWRNHKVVHVGRRGNILCELVSESDGLHEPVAVSYDRKRMRLYVSQLENNKLLVFDLK